MQKTLLLATRNPNKKRELQQLLADKDISVISLEEVNDVPEVEEDGRSFTENAIKKAVQTAEASGMVCLADDSGLAVDALNGQPGIYSARFAGEDADDLKNNEKLLTMMQDVEEGHRTGRFICVIAISDAQGNVQTVEGYCEGKIAFLPSGKKGFGYDPLFIPENFTRSFAELSAKEKNHISHRGKALQKALPLIEALYYKG